MITAAVGQIKEAAMVVVVQRSRGLVFVVVVVGFFFFFWKALRTTILLRGAQNRGDSGFLGSRRARGMSFVGEGPSVVLGKALSRYGG